MRSRNEIGCGRSSVSILLFRFIAVNARCSAGRGQMRLGKPPLDSLGK